MEIRLFLPIITLGPVNPVNPPGNTQRAVISHQWHYPETQRKTTKAKNFHKQIFAAMGNIAQKEEKKEGRKEKEGKQMENNKTRQEQLALQSRIGRAVFTMLCFGPRVHSAASQSLDRETLWCHAPCR